MKQLIALLMALFSFSTSNSQTSIYDIAINDISGKAIDLGAFKSKYILFVNVASECGFTPQYAGFDKDFRNNIKEISRDATGRV